MITICAAIQLNPELFNFDVTIFLAWYFISLLVQLPGWIIKGVTLPSSVVIGVLFIFFNVLVFLSLSLRILWYTICSYVKLDPVKCIWLKLSWLHRYSDAEISPLEIIKKPLSIKGKRICWNTGNKYSLTRFNLTKIVRFIF